mgnify:CR=1 FL=1
MGSASSVAYLKDLAEKYEISSGSVGRDDGIGGQDVVALGRHYRGRDDSDSPRSQVPSRSQNSAWRHDSEGQANLRNMKLPTSGVDWSGANFRAYLAVYAAMALLNNRLVSICRVDMMTMIEAAGSSAYRSSRGINATISGSVMRSRKI